MNSLIVVQRGQRTSLSTTGELFFRGQHECYSLEPPYKTDGSKPRCTPAGTYDLTIRWSEHFQRNMPHVEQVPDFTDIMIHPGNWPKNTDGCTVVGGILGDNYVGESDVEFNALYLKIVDALAEGSQTITYLDPPTASVADLDSEIAA